MRAAEGETRPGEQESGGDNIDVNSMAYHVQQGRSDLILPLWNSVYAYIKHRASVAMRNIPTERGVTVDDLIQCGYFALLSAVDTYDVEKGSFLSWLDKYLKTEFAEAGGYRTTRRGPMDYAYSLDAPIPGGESDTDTFVDIVPDTADPYTEAEERIYNEQLHAALDAAIDRLPPPQSTVVRGRYWESKGLRALSDELGVSMESVRRRENAALSTLRRSSSRNGLAEFMGDRLDYYRGTGLRKYRERGASSVEYTVMRRERLREEWKTQQKETTEEE